MTNDSLLTIVGPTSVGKTGLSLQLAQEFALEIISADSHQVYKGLDIGTAKATDTEQAAVPHHLLDVVEPDKVLTLANFQKLAYATIKAIHQRQHLPVLVGGSGQWVQAVVEGWGIPKVPPDPVLRTKLEQYVETEGSAALHAQLTQVDPQAAQKIDYRNVRRVIRAMEVYKKTGIPITIHQQKKLPPYAILQIGLTMPREQLYHRLDLRVDKMMAAGLLAEVEGLAKAGYGWDKPAMIGLGYRQMGLYLQGQVSLDEAVALIKKETRRFVRQQYNWFRLKDERIHWFDVGDGLSAIYPTIKLLIANRLM